MVRFRNFSADPAYAGQQKRNGGRIRYDRAECDNTDTVECVVGRVIWFEELKDSGCRGRCFRDRVLVVSLPGAEVDKAKLRRAAEIGFEVIRALSVATPKKRDLVGLAGVVAGIWWNYAPGLVRKTRSGCDEMQVGPSKGNDASSFTASVCVRAGAFAEPNDWTIVFRKTSCDPEASGGQRISVRLVIRKIRTFHGLSRAERRLARETLGWMLLARLSLWVLPFQRIQRYCERLGRKRADGIAGTREIAWAVQLTSRYVPRSTCLVRALATQVLLGRYGHEGKVHIGVALDAQSGFSAHAWVESQGKVLVGGSQELDRYAPILVVDGKRTYADRNQP
jgi:hypothetical protein